MIASLVASAVVAAAIVAVVRCLVLLAQRDAKLAERDRPNARLLEPLPRRAAPGARRWTEAEFCAATGLPPRPVRVEYRPGPGVIEAEEVSDGAR